MLTKNNILAVVVAVVASCPQLITLGFNRHELSYVDDDDDDDVHFYSV